MSEVERPVMAESYRVEMGKGLFINDELVPWYIALDPPWRVQPLDDYAHVLWLPVLVKGAIPEYGEPDGTEPAPQPEPADDEGGAA
jgi:hypothetical protein